jgi:Xaa-Pro aminopeptidase
LTTNAATSRPPGPPPSIERAEFKQRQERARAAAAERGLDGLLVWARGASTVDYYGDILYLTGHHTPVPQLHDTTSWTGRGHSALILPVEGDPVLVVDVFDLPRERVPVDDTRTTYHVPQSTGEILAELGLSRAKLGLVGRESLLHAHFDLLRAAAPDVVLEPADEVLRELRAVKSAGELALVRHAASVGNEWMRLTMEALREGSTEGDAVGEGLRYLAANGGYPYDVAVASGPHSEHYERIGIPSWDSERRLERGDLAHVDIWGPVEYYYTDFTRSTVIGRSPTGEQRELLEGSIELIRHLEGIVRPGVLAGEIYEQGTAWLVANGFAPPGTASPDGPLFTESFPLFGHCLGLGLEFPWLIEGADTPLQENMVVAVECLLGRPGIGAAGFEENLIVTADGSENLTAGCPARWWD